MISINDRSQGRTYQPEIVVMGRTRGGGAEKKLFFAATSAAAPFSGSPDASACGAGVDNPSYNARIRG